MTAPGAAGSVWVADVWGSDVWGSDVWGDASETTGESFPGFIAVPTDSPGLEVPCPELGGAYWYEDLSAPAPDRLIISDALDTTVREDVTEGGSATTSVAVTETGTPGLQVELTVEGVWDAFLVDSFEDDLCPGYSPSDPYNDRTMTFLGRSGAGSLVKLTKGHKEIGTILQGYLRPNVIAPAGLGARCLFSNIYLAIEGTTGGWCKVTPVIDGEVLTAEAMAFAIPSDGTRMLHRFEIPLTRTYTPSGTELSRLGIMGTWLTVQIDILDAFGCGRLEVAGLEAEYVVLENSLPGQTFTGEAVNYPSRTASQTWFLGGVGSHLWRGNQGTEDDGVAIPIRLQTNDVAPAGVGGESMFENVYLAVTRDNPSNWTVTLTPIIDGIDQDPVTWEFVGVTDPVSEVVEIALTQPYTVDSVEVSRFTPRGAWFALRIEATARPDGPFTFEGLELEHDALTISIEDVTQ